MGPSFCAALTKVRPRLKAGDPGTNFFTVTLAVPNAYSKKNADDRTDASSMGGLAASCPKVAADVLTASGKQSFTEFGPDAGS